MKRFFCGLSSAIPVAVPRLFFLMFIASIAVFSLSTHVEAQDTSFHNAPASASKMKNPYRGQVSAVKKGAEIYAATCASCHGAKGEGTGNIPPLMSKEAQSASDGELFWFITKGDVANGMPAWKALPEEQRWDVVTFVKTLKSAPKGEEAKAAPAEDHGTKINAPPPPAPFTDFRFEEPGKTRKITVADLPKPFATESAGNPPRLVERPSDVWPKTLPGFEIQIYATGLHNPRSMTTAPNGDIFVSETRAGDVRVFRGMTADGKPEHESVFATDLNQPYQVAFYPPGKDPQWIYVANTNEIVRFPYHNGDMKASGAPQHVADVRDHRGHSTRTIQFTPDGKKMLIGVGSGSNINDPDTHPEEKERANVLEFNPDGSGMRIFAAGIRNPGGGLAIQPETGDLWVSVNERDGLGDNLVTDYITHVQDGGFYGWPWFYIGGHQDPRLEGKHPELKDKVIVPDVLLQPHNGSLGITFYEGNQFPAEYKGDIFAAEHGSWNRAVRAGYEVIRVPMDKNHHATGAYEDFVTGFVLPDGNAWGRPVGVTVAPDGSLLVSDDGTGSIWRVHYTGKK